MHRLRGLLIVGCVAWSGCIAIPLQPLPPTTQLELRAIQSRTYNGADPKTVLRVVLNVLQDDGFLVHYGSLDLGLLDASKTVAEFTTGSLLTVPLTAVIGLGATFPQDVTTIQATANVSEFGSQVRVRINFEARLANADGRVLRVAQVTDAKRYQEFFARLDKGLFLQREGL